MFSWSSLVLSSILFHWSAQSQSIPAMLNFGGRRRSEEGGRGGAGSADVRGGGVGGFDLIDPIPIRFNVGVSHPRGVINCTFYVGPRLAPASRPLLQQTQL